MGTWERVWFRPNLSSPRCCRMKGNPWEAARADGASFANCCGDHPSEKRPAWTAREPPRTPVCMCGGGGSSMLSKGLTGAVTTGGLHSLPAERSTAAANVGSSLSRSTAESSHGRKALGAADVRGSLDSSRNVRVQPGEGASKGSGCGEASSSGSHLLALESSHQGKLEEHSGLRRAASPRANLITLEI